MLATLFRCCLAFTLAIATAVVPLAQTKANRQTPKPPKTETTAEPTTPAEPPDVETLKTDTDLVTVPVVASDRGGRYIADLRKEEFAIEEDGVKQEVAFFGTTAAPFHVVLMLDTSASTQTQLNTIQNAAYTFVQQLKPNDKVKIMSFDDEIRDLNEFTNNRETLRMAINGTRAGQGTKVYDAIEQALNTIRPIRGRKAIVIFTDGMDWFSNHATYQDTVRWLDEEGVIIYPIRYETRAATEEIARQSMEGIGPQLPTSDVIKRPPNGTTAPTFPGGDPIPTSGTVRKSGPLGLPTPEEIMRRRRESDPNRDPGQRVPDDLPPGTTNRRTTTLPPVGSTDTSRRNTRIDDSITARLDMAYATADSYLKTLAEKSGGRLLRADTIASLPNAFAQIAAELSTQYVLGYYPAKKERDDRYRKIAVTTTRKDVVVRSRPGYLPSSR
jgi:Mg-chelatase subunit ChlD